MSGEFAALFSALLWAMASVLLAMGARRLEALPLNLIRCAVSTGFFWALLPFYGGLKALANIPSGAWLWMVVSVLGLLVVGDTLYFRSLDLAGVSWAMPVASINPLWAVLLAALFLDEPLTGTLLVGALLVIAGIILVSCSTDQGTAERPALHRDPEWAVGRVGNPTYAGIAPPLALNGYRPANPHRRRTGLLLAVVVSVLWGIGQVALRPATAGIHSVVANSVRQPMGLVMLLGLTLISRRWHALRRLDGRSLRIILVAGFVGTGVGTLFFIMAIQMAGAGRTAVLTSTAPVMALPFSMLWLKERPGRQTLIGTALTVAGIALVA